MTLLEQANIRTYRILVCSHLENPDLETGKEKVTQFIYTCTRDFRRNLPYFGRTFLRLTDIYVIKLSHIRSFTVAETLEMNVILRFFVMYQCYMMHYIYTARFVLEPIA